MCGLAACGIHETEISCVCEMDANELPMNEFFVQPTMNCYFASCALRANVILAQNNNNLSF